VPGLERWADEVQVPEFEIDAQAVSWERYIEFAEDGGYDRPPLVDARRLGLGCRPAAAARRATWSSCAAACWCSAAAELQRAAGRPAGAAPVAPRGRGLVPLGRPPPADRARMGTGRLTARSRGFVWGDVFEWVAGSARPWPAMRRPRQPGPPAAAAHQGVLRGASFMTPARQRHPKARRFLPPEADHAFCGFRSCAPPPGPASGPVRAPAAPPARRPGPAVRHARAAARWIQRP
jgi:iron(II)-dependent oxidoreductase